MKTQALIKSTRLAWVDITRAFAMFAIYLGHLEEPAGRLWPFVYTFHVPLFFMLSGFFAIPKNPSDFGSFLWKKIKGLLLPFLLFSALSLIILLLTGEKPMGEAKKLTYLSFIGIKNHTPALGLWFFPCLFVITAVYELLRRLLKHPYIIAAIALILFLIEERFLPYRAYQYPRIPWGVDIAMYYMIFYAAGAILFPYLKEFHYKALGKRQKAAFCLISALAVLYWAAVFFHLDGPVFELLACLKLAVFYQLFLAFLGSFLVIGASGLLAAHAKAQVLVYLGQNTLYLCGSETIIKTLTPWFLSLIGITYAPATPVGCLVYSAILFLVAGIIIIPLEKELFFWIKTP